MAQILAQIPRIVDYDKNVAKQVQDLLANNPGMRLENVIPIPVMKVGGLQDYEYLVVLTDDPVAVMAGDVQVQVRR